MCMTKVGFQYGLAIESSGKNEVKNGGRFTFFCLDVQWSVRFFKQRPVGVFDFFPGD